MPAGGHAPGSLGGNRRLAPVNPQPHTEHGANIRGPVESGGYRQPYRQSNPSGTRNTIRYSPPPPKGSRGTGPSGRLVYHTKAGWRAIRQANSRKAKQQPALNALHALTGLTGIHPSAIAQALLNPKAAGQAGETLRQASEVGKGLIRQEARALQTAPRNVGKTKYTGVEAVPGDVLGAAKDVAKEVVHPDFLKGYQNLQRTAQGGSLENRIGNLVTQSGKLGEAAVGALKGAQVIGHGNTPKEFLPSHASQPTSKAQNAGVNVEGQLSANALKNLIEFPAQSVSTAYQVGKAGVAAAQGNTQPAKKLVKGYAKTGFLPALLTGHVGEAAQRFEKNPVFSVAEVRGAAAIPGRAAGAIGRQAGGAAARAGVPGAADIYNAASTKREPLKLAPGQHVTRHYSPDILVKAAQVAKERGQARRGLDPNQAQGKQLPRLLKQRATQHTEVAEVSRRAVRAQEQQAATRAQTPTRRAVAKAKVTATLPGVKTRPAAPGVVPTAYADGLVHAIAERRIRSEKTFVPDVKAELARMQAEQPNLAGPMLKENRRNIRSLSLALKDPNLEQHVPELMRAGNETAKVTRAQGEELAKQGIYDPAQIRRARLFPYAVSHMEAKHVPVVENGAVTGHRLEVPAKSLFQQKSHLTRPVSDAEIEAHMKAAGVEPPGFISHNPSRGGAREYYQASRMTRGSGSKARRTGEATRKGTMGTSYQGIVGQRVGGAGKVEQAKQFDRMVREMTNKPPKQGGHETVFKTHDAAKTAIYNLQHDSHGNELPNVPDYAIVNMRPRGGTPDQRAMIQQLQQGSASMKHIDKIPGQKALAASMDTGPGEYRIMPQAQLDTINEQARGRNTAERAVGSVTQQFRGTVLPFSTKWFTGNIVEEYGIRLPANAIGPHSMHVGSLILKELEEKDAGIAQQFAAITHQGRLYGSTPRTLTHTSAEQFQGTALQGPANALALVRRTPVVKQAINALIKYQTAVFKFNSKIEGGGELGAIGKIAKQHASELGEFGQSWLKVATMGRQLAEQVAGKVAEDPNLKFEFANGVDEILGKYSGFSPAVRHIVQTYAPFLPWYLNSIRFVYWTLPVKHPIKTAVLAAGEEALQKDFEQSTLPENLRGAIQTKGGLLDVGHYTPFGAFSDPGNLAGVALPQLDSSLNALKGQDFTGREIQVPTGKTGPRGGKQKRALTNAEKVKLAAYTQAESLAPGLRIARQLLEGGSTPEPTSTITSPKTKPGTQVDVLNRVLNPFRPIKLKSKKGKKTAKKKTSSGAYGGGGPDPYETGGGAYGGGSPNPY